MVALGEGQYHWMHDEALNMMAEAIAQGLYFGPARKPSPLLEMGNS